MRFKHAALLTALLWTLPAAASPQDVPIDVAALGNPAVAAQAMPELARRLLAAGIPDAQTRLALSLVAGDSSSASVLMQRFTNLDAARVEYVLANKDPFGSWSDALQSFKGRTSLDVTEAVELAAAYAPQAKATPELIDRDARRRFIIQRVSIAASDGVALAAIVVRARTAAPRLPSALLYTIYAQPSLDTLRAEFGAARGYASVTAYSRGKAWGSGKIAPYEDDGRDADRTITWIAKQPWSNGAVGMYSGSYNGFTQWAAAKFHNPALKTIVPYVANNPGNGLPMENNISLLVNYPWVYYVTDNRYLDDAAYTAPAMRDLNDRWYKSGKSYRELPSFFGRPNPWLQKWLDHPSFDGYWQSMVPYKDDFSNIDIPTLTVTGYYDDGQGSALNFLKDHQAYNPRAVDYLIIGPYDHFGSQHAHKDDVLRGYAIDSVAQYSTPKLTFDWFDWVLRGGPRPSLLTDRINFEVMGANVWRHAHTLSAMAGSRQRYYLSPHALSTRAPLRPSFMTQTVNFADRKTANGDDYYPFPILGAKPNLSRGLVFQTAPLSRDAEIDGFFTGRLQVIINKRDFDMEAVLYQVLPDGRLMHLSYFMGRASYGDDGVTRRLFVPGVERTITFDRSRFVSRSLQKGSRLMLVLDVVKNSFAEINYGTGGDVSREDIRDA
ncbi:MAG TPA: CocE/NonD family hydrolase, partial [Candidatus Acidoferrales bacterium]|nr:CocE/NonD family hydrolase [Candidatus Acidoferrales bacterium]